MVSSDQSGSPDTRRRILDAALRSFEEGDAGAPNVGTVARYAGVSRQAVYLHFPSRSALAVEALRWLDEREDVMAATAGVRKATSAAAALDAYARFLADYNPRIARVASMAYRLRTLPDLEEAWLDRLNARRGGGMMIARMLAAEKRLHPPFTVRSAGDWLAAMGSVLLWEELTQDLGWSSKRYEQHMRASFHSTFGA